MLICPQSFKNSIILWFKDLISQSCTQNQREQMKEPEADYTENHKSQVQFVSF